MAERVEAAAQSIQALWRGTAVRRALEDDWETMSDDEYDSACDSTPVLLLHCANALCGQILCRRGMEVFLAADSAQKLYSTDLRTPNIVDSAVSAPSRAIGSCECRICDTACRYCRQCVGYHVVEPCALCAADNNGHYIMFHQAAVQATPRMAQPPAPPSTTMEAAGDTAMSDEPGAGDGASSSSCAHVMCWNELARLTENEHNSDDDTLGHVTFKDTPPDDVVCPICFEVMMEASILTPCGHPFCCTCIMRHVDNFKCCPLCRTKCAHSDIQPAVEMRGRIGALLTACRFDCGRWIAVSQRDEHHSVCHMRTA